MGDWKFKALIKNKDTKDIEVEDKDKIGPSGVKICVPCFKPYVIINVISPIPKDKGEIQEGKALAVTVEETINHLSVYPFLLVAFLLPLILHWHDEYFE